MGRLPKTNRHSLPSLSLYTLEPAIHRPTSALVTSVRRLGSYITRRTPRRATICPRNLDLGKCFAVPQNSRRRCSSQWIFNLSILEQIPPDAKKTPILWAHGIADSTVLFEVGQAGPHFLERAGLSCKFKAYPGLGHPINTEEPHYLESWIRARLQSSS